MKSINNSFCCKWIPCHDHKFAPKEMIIAIRIRCSFLCFHSTKMNILTFFFCWLSSQSNYFLRAFRLAGMFVNYVTYALQSAQHSCWIWASFIAWSVTWFTNNSTHGKLFSTAICETDLPAILMNTKEARRNFLVSNAKSEFPCTEKCFLLIETEKFLPVWVSSGVLFRRNSLGVDVWDSFVNNLQWKWDEDLTLTDRPLFKRVPTVRSSITWNDVRIWVKPFGESSSPSHFKLRHRPPGRTSRKVSEFLWKFFSFPERSKLQRNSKDLIRSRMKVKCNARPTHTRAS